MDIENTAYTQFLKDIENRLQYWDGNRILKRRQRKGFLVLGIVIEISLFYFFTGSSLTNGLVFLSLLNLLLIFLLYVLPSSADSFEDDFKNDAIRKMFKSIDPQWKFNAVDGVAAKGFLSSDLYHLPLNKLEEFDHVFGDCEHLPFSIALIKASESATYSGYRAPAQTIFTVRYFGLCYYIIRMQPFAGTLLLFSKRKRGINNESDSNQNESESCIRTNHGFSSFTIGEENFDKEFTGYFIGSGNVFEFLDLSLRANLITLRNRVEGPLSVSFIDHRMSIHCGDERNFLSFSPSKEINAAVIDQNLKEFCEKFQFVELFGK